MLVTCLRWRSYDGNPSALPAFAEIFYACSSSDPPIPKMKALPRTCINKQIQAKISTSMPTCKHKINMQTYGNQVTVAWWRFKLLTGDVEQVSLFDVEPCLFPDIYIRGPPPPLPPPPPGAPPPKTTPDCSILVAVLFYESTVPWQTGSHGRFRPLVLWKNFGCKWMPMAGWGNTTSWALV